MKKLLFLLSICILSIHIKAQKISVDKDGNYHATKHADINTGKTYTDDSGKVYIVYANTKNKLYIIRKSKKTGKEYKSYLKTN